MCLKQENRNKEELAEQIIKECNDLKDMLEEGKLKERLYEYELIKLNSKTPLLDEQARSLIGITSEEYIYITENYDELIAKDPDVKERALRHLEYIKSANIAKIIALKGCENCRLIVCKKLDVKIDDLCDNCKKLIAEYKL